MKKYKFKINFKDNRGVIADLLQKKIEYDWTDNGETMFYKARNEMVNLWNKI